MSLLFEVFNAITGSKAAPATHNMPRDCRHVLQHMANRADNDSRLYDFAAATVEADADLCAAVVRRCIAELVIRGWLVFHGWSGPRNNAHRVYEVRADGSGWERSTAMAREAPPRRRARLALTPDVTPDSAVTPGVGPGCDGMSPRGDTGCRPGVTPGVDLPPDLPPLLPLREPPSAPAQARAGHGPSPAQIPLSALADGGQLLPLPGFPAFPSPAAAVEDSIFAAYLEGRTARGVKGAPPVLDGKRRAMIRGRLKDGFEPDALRTAARGLWASDWHVAERRTGFELCMRDAGAVEKCLGYAAAEPKRAPSASDGYPEADQIPHDPPRRPRPPEPPIDPQILAEAAEMAKLPMSELLRRQAAARGFAGVP